MDEIKVLMVGNASTVKGGITSVITQLLNHEWEKNGVKMSFVSTYECGSIFHKIIYFASAYLKIKTKIQFQNTDIVHIHMSYKGSFIRKYAIHKLCVKNGIPDIIHLHGSEFKKWYDETDKRTQEKIRKMLRECASFIVLGNEWEKAVRQIEPLTKTVVVRNTVRIPDEMCSWNEKGFQVLFLGVLIKRKGVSDLLKAIRVIKESGNLSNIKFVIAGSGEEEKLLHDEVRKLDIEDCTQFTGWISGEKKVKLLKASQMIVLPSYNEGLPIAVLEAISYGLPVVATDVGDISSAVRDGKNGYLIAPGDIEQLAFSILKIHDDKERYTKMSRLSRQIAETDFSDSSYFENLVSCYRKGNEEKSL